MNGKHRIMEGEEKAWKRDGHQHGRKPTIPEPVLIVWDAHLGSERHWTPTGADPMKQWMDGINTMPNS